MSEDEIKIINKIRNSEDPNSVMALIEDFIFGEHQAAQQVLSAAQG